MKNLNLFLAISLMTLNCFATIAQQPQQKVPALTCQTDPISIHTLEVWGNTLGGIQVQLLRNGKISHSFFASGDIESQSLKFDLYSKGPGDDGDLYETGTFQGRYDQISGVFESKLTLKGKKFKYKCILPF